MHVMPSRPGPQLVLVAPFSGARVKDEQFNQDETARSSVGESLDGAAVKHLCGHFARARMHVHVQCVSVVFVPAAAVLHVPSEHYRASLRHSEPLVCTPRQKQVQVPTHCHQHCEFVVAMVVVVTACVVVVTKLVLAAFSSLQPLVVQIIAIQTCVFCTVTRFFLLRMCACVRLCT